MKANKASLGNEKEAKAVRRKWISQKPVNKGKYWSTGSEQRAIKERNAELIKKISYTCQK